MNTQMARQIERGKPYQLSVNEVFYSIQGEGPLAGVPAVFIRLAGCNLACPECDTKYGHVATHHPDGLALRARQLVPPSHRNYVCVITGGEPFRQSIGPLIEALQGEGFLVQIETNGTTYDPLVDYNDVIVVCSPKTPVIAEELLEHITAYKYVGDFQQLSIDDGLPITVLGYNHIPARPPENFDGNIYLQPIDHGVQLHNDLAREAVVESCLEHGYTVCLQLHKLLDLE
jgi:organic radical activating enzyme